MLTTTATAAPAKASAAHNGACGSGYSVVNSVAVGTKGTVYLTYSGATGKNCVVTVRNGTGTAVPMSAWIQLAEDHETTPVVDSGEYTTYAGPVYLAAKGQCVNWGGYIQNQDVEVDKTNCGKLAATGG
ncbi:spore-associated protein A [Streptomyces sp. M19]